MKVFVVGKGSTYDMRGTTHFLSVAPVQKGKAAISFDVPVSPKVHAAAAVGFVSISIRKLTTRKAAP